ncbi:hypothetical protein OEZ86_002088 [Tetradesmus obliquus]|nr:hypothetical protein OEZ86_002088 [Tetradesmus obliquus]
MAALLASFAAPLARVKVEPRVARPIFHLAPTAPRGWINDPNGPLLHNGTYHLFWQNVPNSSEWSWGLGWGHATSKDLVQWQPQPVALEPSPGGLDRHGCFSGCATVDENGVPSILYTGVIRKTPEEMEPGGSHQHEAQLLAVATDPADPELKEWVKLPGQFLPQPPADMALSGWRDPFILERPSASSPWWYVMVGAGVKETCGTALVYRSGDLRQGWQYVGPLCESPPAAMHTIYAGGRFELAAAAGPQRLDLGDILYAPNVLTDDQGRTVLWAWMQEKQQLRPAGAYDSACCLCVPRVLYLSPDGSRLLQQPLPELSALRQQRGAWHVGKHAADGEAACTKSLGDADAFEAPLALLPGVPMQLGGSSSSSSSSSSSHVDVELTLARGEAESVVLLLQPFEGLAGAAGAGIAYCWATDTLQVIHTTDLATLEAVAAMPVPTPAFKRLPGPSPEEAAAEAAAAAAAAAASGVPLRCGGALLRGAPADEACNGNSASSKMQQREQQQQADVPAEVTLRVLIDGSCVEVFAGGQALGTRVYRGDEHPLDHIQPAAELAASMAALTADAAASGTCGALQLMPLGEAEAAALSPRYTAAVPVEAA